MRLSMQMLRDQLQQYEPEADIKKNERQLRSVRLFSENLRYSSSTVYLMPMEYGRIVCSNENDILVLHADDVNEISNAILDILEFYRDGEDEAQDLIDRGGSAKELLERLAEMTGFFLILADASFYMRETAGPEKIAENHTGLEGMIHEHMMPLSVLQKINAEPKIRMHGVAPYRVDVPGLGTAAVANLFAGGRHEGWLIACKETFDFTQGELDLLDGAARIMERWFRKRENTESQSEKADMFRELLRGEQEDDSRIRERLHTFGWFETDAKQVFALHLPKDIGIPPETVIRRLEVLFPDAFVLSDGEAVILLVNYALNDEKQIRGRLEAFLAQMLLSAGESELFTDILNLKQPADAAKTAALYAEDARCSRKDSGKEEGNRKEEKASRICRFSDIAIPYAADILREQALPEVVHPALKILETYDAGHEAALTQTLKTFLEENCSYTAAAERLFIHRSTLLYRLDRITELTGIDLTSPEERFRPMLSFYITQKDRV